MGSSSGRQLLLLMWKNWLLQKKKVVLTICEIALPTVLVIMTWLIRQEVEAVNIEEHTHWRSFNVDNLPANLTPPNTQPFQDPVPWLLSYSPNEPVVTSVMERLAKKLNMSVDGKS